MSDVLKDIMALAAQVRQQGEILKQAFVPVVPGMSPGETGAVVDQVEGAMAQQPPPGAEGMPPPGAPPGPPMPEEMAMMIYDIVVQAVRQVMQEMGTVPGGKTESKQPTNRERIEQLEGKIDEMMMMLGGGMPPPGAEPEPAGFGPGSGEAAPPPPMGPLDPNAAPPPGIKMGSLAANGRRIAAALRGAG